MTEMSEQKEERRYSTMTQAELDAWDAEIEVDYRKAVAATKRPGKLKRDQRFVGCPWGFLVDVRSRTLNGAALVVALYVFRMAAKSKSRTVKLSGAELAELKVGRIGRHKALHILAAAGLIRLHRAARGRAGNVELLWRPYPNSNGTVSKWKHNRSRLVTLPYSYSYSFLSLFSLK